MLDRETNQGATVPRTRPIAIRFTGLELSVLETAARRAGMPTSSYVREVSVARALRQVGEAEIEEERE